MPNTIPFSKAQKRLVVLWCTFSVIIFIVFLVQMINDNKFGDHTGEVWEWLFQFLLPPLTLMIGVLISQLTGNANKKETDIFYFRLANGFSYFYLILLLSSSFLAPMIHQNLAEPVLVTELTPENEMSIIEAFQSYNAFMIPVQGITILTLGLFFSKTN